MIAPDSSTSLLAGSEAGLFRYNFGKGKVKETKINDEPAYQILSLTNGDVVELQDGHIEIESKVNQGTTFIVTFPIFLMDWYSVSYSEEVHF